MAENGLDFPLLFGSAELHSNKFCELPWSSMGLLHLLAAVNDEPEILTFSALLFVGADDVYLV